MAKLRKSNASFELTFSLVSAASFFAPPGASPCCLLFSTKLAPDGRQTHIAARVVLASETLAILSPAAVLLAAV